MKLDVLPDEKAPWYADGLKFTCTQCGNCCTGPAGFVWISDMEIGRVAEYLQMSAEQVSDKYTRAFGERRSLKERRTPEGNYDCIFLKEQSGPDGGPSPSKKKSCSIYSVRPLQCRTWPFWPENLSTPEAWKHSGKRCHGMGNGHRHFSLQQIETLRDARDWPQNPPTSAK